MASRQIFKFSAKLHNVCAISTRCCSGKVIRNEPSGTTSTSVQADVTGLSGNCIKMTNENDPVGPGASKVSPNYKNPEYFCYDKNTYFEAEIEMLKYRCPQPSSLN